ncbi:urea ABC transporter ATP-binding subunit UrtE [Paraburkholderia unamae]|uniref:Amino acid/amide ABC transporter ATP-binding protein 2 (HAAT family) n=1 Tax=Paraburkholderia unamae TaxID=219649 RepID=A0ABX5KNH0_9BURK|nr:urea ABC transporter ATP-binding subunit UrtE [Paraburkholderia unamae]PVX81737.1 amino acid/amide ABC transporter ATP-binding protein 2 (HAAT family) [Paraburkholderia unamae]RAR62550.1 amino acid/amide ABC transporter ATP-binding protein 2 (HAAT family) [Paraburkholderia unamae]CAG9265446.1 Urea ABC transporter, ATPase protein UrtE [Paraburkholderia unamae]
MLKIDNLNVFYGESHVLHDLSFDLSPGETVAVMGRNGMGKTTLLKSLIGMIATRSGKIELNGRELAKAKSYERVAAGFGFVPQGRMIFPYLSVEENILSGMDRFKRAEIPEYIYDAFPVLYDMRARRGGNLSGGQQQQLAIARALVSEPKVLILDEPTEGIQPSIIKDIARALNRLKKERDFALIVSEQVLSFTLDIADRFLIIEKGRFVHSDTRANVDADRITRYLTI